MREVIRIDEPKQALDNPVEFTHVLNGDDGWSNTAALPKDFHKVVYLGNCSVDGDMFAAYSNAGLIIIFKGHLNSGKY